MRDGLHAGFVGLGDMGAPMARHLLGRGFPTIVADVRADAVAALVTAGAKPAESPAETADGADVIAVCVVDDAQATSVITGENGLCSRLRTGQAVVLHSSVRPETVTTATILFPHFGHRVIRSMRSSRLPVTELFESNSCRIDP